MSSLKQRLKNGENVLGTMITMVDNPDIIAILKACGFDFAIVDCEHGSFSHAQTARLAGVARAAGFPCLVRVPDVRREGILKHLEMGMSGILLPNCDSADDARALVEHGKYAPLGNRGVSLLRPHTGYAKPASGTEYMVRANEENLLVVQVESSASVDNIDAIMAVEGVDAAFIGPSDLSQSYGLMDRPDHPTIAAAVDKVVAAAKNAGKFSGMSVLGAPSNVRKWIDKGMTLNLWANEVTMILSAGKEGLKQARQ